MSMWKKCSYIFLIIGFVLFLSGCNLLDKNEKIDPPQSVTYTDEDITIEDEETTAEGKKEAADGQVMTELYLIDKDGYVVPQTLPLPKTESVARQALEYLVQDGPVTNMLPNGFRAVLPPDTGMTVDIVDGTAIVDFTKEFQNYNPEDELKILQSIVWTLTQFDTIDKVKLKLNGHELNEMPVNKTPISDTLSRTNGINFDTSDVIDITNTKAVTVYYIGGDEENYYYVPVTKRISNDVENNIEGIVAELVNGPNYHSNLLTDFLPDVQLVESPIIENGTVTLNFNEYIYGSFEEKIISEHLLNTLVLSLTEQEGIEKVSILVNGKAELAKENGQKIVEPVSRPEIVNTGSF